MPRGRRHNPRRRARSPRPSPPPAPAPPPELLTRIRRWAARMGEAGGEALLRWFAAAWLRRLLSRSASSIDIGEERRGGGGVEADRDGGGEATDAAAPTTGEEPLQSAAAADGKERGGEDGGGDEDGSGDDADATPTPTPTPTPVEVELPPTGARSEGAHTAAAVAPRASAPRKQQAAGRKNSKKAARRPPPPPADPFEDGYHIAQLFSERQERQDRQDHDDEVALSYANCRCRASKLGDKKKREEVCHICFFSRGIVRSFRKHQMKDHCENEHTGSLFPCQKEGCVVRCETLQEAGLHYFYLHQQRSRDWWRLLLLQHGFDC